MLYGGRHTAWLGEIVTLVAADIGPRHGGSQIRVFARALRGASPAGIAADVDHGRVKPAHACRAGLFCGDAPELYDEFRIEACGQAKRYGIDGAKAVNDIGPEEQWNMQAAPLNGQVLISVGARCANGVEHGTQPAGGSQFHYIQMIGGDRVDSNNDAGLIRRRLCAVRRGRGRVAGVVVLDELPDLFFERHLTEQIVYTCLDGWIRKLRVGWSCSLTCRVRRKACDCQAKRET